MAVRKYKLLHKDSCTHCRSSESKAAPHLRRSGGRSKAAQPPSVHRAKHSG